ncbi:MAG: amylo-alpha-1,6-glucosidase [Tunicatimonas sp.]|uniref:amylo-alpha-1,6-glucosidase n=1 Tax=Tunicatimonas sp. TaxID=1940096 RepID=UPI003C7409A2
MSYIQFDKKQLLDLSYSLNKEIIRSNKAGAYSSTTIVGCNTKRYHGLLVAHQPGLEGVHVLLSSLDETIIVNNASFNLGVHKYPNEYNPNGFVYMKDFTADPIPKSTYRMKDVVLTREFLLVEHEDRVLMRYTVEQASEEITLRLFPFLAFRNVNQLMRANEGIQPHITEVEDGVSIQLYPEYQEIFMQVSNNGRFTPQANWYYNIEYPEDLELGASYQEDLYVPGYFEVKASKGDIVLFTGGPDVIKAGNLLRMFNNQTRKRTARSSFENCLKVSAEQFVLKTRSTPEARKYDRTDVIASYQRYRRGGRDAFIAIPGLSLVQGDLKSFKAVLDTMLKYRKGAFFPFWKYNDSQVTYEAIDTPLWFFWALQQYTHRLGDRQAVWKSYGTAIREILESYRDGTEYQIKMQDDGLLSGSEEGIALTWMDAYIDGKPVTPRGGFPVEVNALWYNAVCFALEIAGPRSTEGKKVLSEWKGMDKKIKKSFLKAYWNQEKGYLADLVSLDRKNTDWSIRPNQILAASLPFSPLSDAQISSIIEVVKKELLTPRGLRSLSRQASDYRGNYQGTQTQRRLAYHQGSVWPWLMGHYVEAYLKVAEREEALPYVTSLYRSFEETMPEHGISSISEVYDGDAPHAPRGAISQAWNVAEIIRMGKLIEEFDKVTQPVSL